MIPGRAPAGIQAGSPDLIGLQRRVQALDSSTNPKQDQLANYLIQLTQQNKVGTPEYFIAAGEYQNRQKMRQEQQAKQPDQPKVIQKLIANAAQDTAMNQGIPALPAQNVGGYAPGGIVAFEDGGSVPRYQGQFGSVVRMPTQPTFITAMNNPSQMDPTALRAYLLSRGEPLPVELMTEEERRNMARSGARPPVDLETRNRLQAGIAQIPGATPAPAAVTPANVPIETPAEAVKKTAAAGIPDLLAGAAAPDYERLMGRAKGMTKDIMGPKPTVPTDDEALGAEREMYKKAGVDFDLFKKQIAEERKALELSKGDRSEAANLRLIEAGLGILGGESPHAFVNIGKGAAPALKGFQEDIKELKKIERDRNKAIRELQTADNQLAQGLGKSAADRKRKAEDRIDNYNERTAMIQANMANTLFSGSMQKYVADVGARTTMARYGQQDVYENRQRAAKMASDAIAKERANPASALKFQQNPNYEEEMYNALFTRFLNSMETGSTSAGKLQKNPDGTFSYTPQGR
jgi:hypothetical protein